MPAALRWLIDGYNLLFQSNWVGKGRGEKWLERARQRMLAEISRQMPPDEVASTRVVFDASGMKRLSGEPQSELTLESGLQVSYASDHAEADDLLEEIIQAHPHAKSLTVVSSDLRLRRKAKARRAKTLTSEEFLDALCDQPGTLFHRFDQAKPAQTEDDDSQNRLSDEEVGYWLRKFNQP